MLKTVGKKTFDFLLIGLLAGVVAAFNLFLIRSWFSGNGPANLGSIEVSYILMSKWLVENWPHLSWNPVWYLGFPFHLFYTPVLPVLVALDKVIFNLSFWQAYRVLTGVGFILGPVSLFFLVFYLTRNHLAAFSSSVLYSIMPNIFNFILPSGEVRQDSLTAEFVDSRRLVNLTRWGEGPHIFSLVFLPLAGLFFFKALRERNFASIFLATLFIGLTALTNAIGLNALVLLLASIFLVRIFFYHKERIRGLITTILITFLTYGLVAFWYNLSFVGTFFAEGGGVLENWLAMFPWGFLALAGGIFIFLFVFRKFIKDEAITAIFLWTLGIFLIVAIYYLSAPAELWQQRVELFPQALRLMPEVDMGLAVLAGLFISLFSVKLSQKNKFLGLGVSLFLGVAVIIPSVLYGLSYAPMIQSSLKQNVDFEKTNEKKIADWLATHVDPTKGERAFLVGNPVFYLNYFTNVWQLRGGLYQAKTHPWPEHIYYQLRMGKDPEITSAWLRIINAKYALVDPGGEIQEKEKFKIFPLAWTLVDGTLVYEIPLTDTSPIKIIDLGLLASIESPKKADDKGKILAYTQWLLKKDNKRATFARINNDLYKIRTDVRKGEGILVQMTADEGWRAKSDLGKVSLKKDPLGFIVLIPAKEGRQEIVLSYGRTGKIWLGYFLTLTTLLTIILFLLKKRGGSIFSS